MPRAPLNSVIGFVVAGVVLLAIGFGVYRARAGQQGDAKYAEVLALPEGIEVMHTPNPARATRGGRSGQRYTYQYETTVRSLVGDLKIEEFGAFTKEWGRWQLSTIYNRPFSASEFAEWYECPGSLLSDGQACSDKANYTGSDTLNESESLWYFVGVAADGARYRGTAISKLARQEHPSPADHSGER